MIFYIIILPVLESDFYHLSIFCPVAPSGTGQAAFFSQKRFYRIFKFLKLGPHNLL